MLASITQTLPPVVRPAEKSSRTGFIPLFTSLVFLILTLNVDAGFRTRAAIESIGETGEGGLMRQLVYASIMLLSVSLLVKRQSLNSLIALFPLSMLTLFTWALITLFWSPVPAIGGRRLILTMMTAVTVFSLAAIQPPAVLLHRFRQVVVTLALASLALVIVAPELAIHQPDDPEVSIIGDWRGVFYHKNIFGSVLAPAVLITFHELLTHRDRTRRRLTLTLMFLLGMLWMSGSKTSFGLATILMLFHWLLLHASRRRGGLLVLGALIYFAFMLAGSAIVLWLNTPGNHTLIDDGSFTGRGLIWYSMFKLLEGRELFGIGFQSVFQVGLDSPLMVIFDSRFFLTLSHAHSAYIEMIVSMGWIGLAIFIFAFIFAPIARIFQVKKDDFQSNLIALSIILLTLLHGLLEAGLLDRDRTMWVVFLLGYGVLRNLPLRKKLRHVP